MNRQGKILLILSIKRVIGGAAAVCLLACNGCALIPLTTVGAVVDIAGTAASAGPAVFKAGKLDSAFMADSVLVEDAVRSAAADLGLHMIGHCTSNKRGDVFTFEFDDDLKTNIEVVLERRTRILCVCRVDVGLLGSEPTARLLMSQIEHHLPPPPATQPTTSVCQNQPYALGISGCVQGAR
jgi:hypothetical protein